jgi:competence CoiA-like predicted nuclease
MVYNGQKESPRHDRLKNLIAEQISKDERFKEINVEKRFVGISKDWRKPDVSAIFNGKKVVFELQLNTTFLSVITERNLFYQDNQTYILWVFDHKRKNIDDMRFMEKDIVYPNHHNAFFINEAVNDGQFKLFCYYEEPNIVDGSIENVWQLKEIDFGDLTFSADFQVYWFHYEKKKKSLLEEIEQNKFLEFGKVWRSASYEERSHLLDRYSHILRGQCKDFNFHELSNLLDCLYSIKFKEPIGYKYVRVVQLLHQYLGKDTGQDSHFGEYVFKSIRVYAHDHIKKEDRTKKLSAKAIDYRKKGFKQSDKYDPFLKRLFPELFLEEMKNR